MIFPGVLSALPFALTLSYNEFPRTLPTSGSNVTMSIAIYGTFAVEIRPNVFAFGILTTLFSFAVPTVYEILMDFFSSKARGRTSDIQEEIA